MAFSLLFINPDAPPEERWNFSNHFVIDPHTNHPATFTEEEKEKIELIFMFVQEGIKRILGGEVTFKEIEEPVFDETIH